MLKLLKRGIPGTEWLLVAILSVVVPLAIYLCTAYFSDLDEEMLDEVKLEESVPYDVCETAEDGQRSCYTYAEYKGKH
jgi:hypothetical protein